MHHLSKGGVSVTKALNSPLPQSWHSGGFLRLFLAVNNYFLGTCSPIVAEWSIWGISAHFCGDILSLFGFSYHWGALCTLSNPPKNLGIVQMPPAPLLPGNAKILRAFVTVIPPQYRLYAFSSIYVITCYNLMFSLFLRGFVWAWSTK